MDVYLEFLASHGHTDFRMVYTHGGVIDQIFT